MAGADLAFRLVAFVVGIDAVGRVGEPDRAVRLHDDVVWAVEALALEAVGVDGDAPVMLRARDAPVAVLAGDEPALPVDDVAVGITCGITEHAGLPGGLVPSQHAVVRDIAPDEIAMRREVSRSLGPAAALVELFDLRCDLDEVAEAVVEDLVVADAHAPLPNGAASLHTGAERSSAVRPRRALARVGRSGHVRAMRAFDTPLPIDEALPELAAALAVRPNAVLVAPPGAGKTTRVPLALLDEPWVVGRKLIVLEPRRLAARAAADRMARTLGEEVGETVGLRVRLGSKVGRKTRIEDVTEGVFTRMILDDPELTGVAGVLFDEFHERSLDADLGLALALDAQGALREDLRLLVMSATLDGARVAGLLGQAPVIRSEGRAYPVETRYLGRDPNRRIEDLVADAVLRALRTDAGSILVFLPGQGEIRRVETRLRERIADPAIDLAPLYGALDRAEQDGAVAPSPPGRRKIVLATSIAETSLTIDGVRVVVDSGLSRVPRYEPDIGLTRLETVRVSRAGADQRRGRAGRTELGVCYRLWDEPQTASLEPFQRPEILSADLSPLLLDCAAWGVADPGTLAFLDSPPRPALSEARALLAELGALDGHGRITERGRLLRALPLPPRLANMVVAAGAQGRAGDAADLAAVLVERGLGGDAVDLTGRVERFRRERSTRAEDMRRLARGWAEMASNTSPQEGEVERTEGAPGEGGSATSPDKLGLPPPPGRRYRGDSASPIKGEGFGPLLALAYPDRLAKARGRAGEFLLANGRGAALEPHERLAR